MYPSCQLYYTNINTTVIPVITRIFRSEHACGYYRYIGGAVGQGWMQRGLNFKRHAEVARESTVSSNVAADRITCRVHCVLLPRQPFAGGRPCD